MSCHSHTRSPCSCSLSFSVIFGANSAAQKALLAERRKRQRPAVLTYPDLFLCGGLAGAVNAFVVAPVELVRNRLVVLKVNGSSRNSAFPSYCLYRQF